MRTCSECGVPLEGNAKRKTCSDAHRAKRARRIRAGHKAAVQSRTRPEHQREIDKIVRSEAPDVVHEVVREELRPVVREALTEETLEAVGRMIGLAPRAVELLGEDLESSDALVRQRAYTLVTKYTIGHPALLKADDVDQSKQLVVHLNLPRPEADAEATAEELPEAEEDTQPCDQCGQDKPLSAFEQGSTRCRECFDRFRADVLERFGPDA